MSDISVRNLSFGYDENLVFDGINLEYDCKDFLAIIGPNGGGKSTLLKLMLGLSKPSGGTIEVFGQEPASVSKAVGYVPQNIPINQSFPMRVLEVVLMGRIDKKLFGFYGKDDKIEAEAALECVGMGEFMRLKIGELSGGQRQRAWIAMAIAQDTEILFLDEPTSFLDVAHQMEVLRLVQHLNEAYGKTIIMVLHELNQAARFADCLVGMCRGQLLYCGTPEEVFHKEMLRRVFGIDAEIMRDPRTGRPMCIPYFMDEAGQLA